MSMGLLFNSSGRSLISIYIYCTDTDHPNEFTVELYWSELTAINGFL